MFKNIETELGTRIIFTDKTGKEWFVPEDETNTDYQAYLAWLEENK